VITFRSRKSLAMIGQSARLDSRAAVVVVSSSQPLIVSRPPNSPTNSKKVGPKQCRIRRWAYVLLLFLFSALSVRPIISTSTRPIFAAFAVLVELRLWMNDLKLVLRSLIGRCRGNQFCGPNPDPIHTTRLVGDGKAKKSAQWIVWYKIPKASTVNLAGCPNSLIIHRVK